MAAKFYPTAEQLDTIMTMYATGSSYAAIGREVGISGAVAKRVITDFNTGENPIKKPEKNKSKDTSQKHSYMYSGEIPVEPQAPISKAQFYYQLQLLMKRMVENVSR